MNERKFRASIRHALRCVNVHENDRHLATTEDMLQAYSDSYKDVHGFRPEWIWSDWIDRSVEEIGDELDRLWSNEKKRDNMQTHEINDVVENKSHYDVDLWRLMVEGYDYTPQEK